MKENTFSPNPEFIYHLVLKSEFKNQCKGNFYTPINYNQDGFIHCTSEEDITVLVANDYFSKETDVLALKIRLSKVTAKVVFENPAPIAGGGNSHLKKKILFPHIYGNLNLNSIEGIGKLPKINYVFHFPKQFITLTQYIEGNSWI